ncbi:pyridoxamine 5'-phosphate oxidase family protein [Jeotgalicoccus huakuii]|uniref:pyridoxamine 5'-phosphate oxidase family protein n=1 Tax=Jeotgalicoccus TaxID=227979 RepID=UPI000409B4FC|nr:MULTISPECIES: pyridoxamine 5'-phosphate oxidase family protein [Jeotgalicoccus]MCK1976796.1 pyridoxamine 5'-phosphate oxidase family protein [Jeotgalicoccus huakuii]
MNNKVIENKAIKILDSSNLGVLSTAHNNIPNSRYMIFYNDGLTLYSKTDIDSNKIEEFKNNPRAHVLIGYSDTNDHSFLEIDGEVSISEDPKIIDWIWNNQDKSFFNSKQDDNLCIIQVKPKIIKVMNSNDLDSPETIVFD